MKNAPNPQLRHLPVVNSKKTAPQQRARFESVGCASLQHRSYELERWRLTVGAVHRREDSPARAAYREDRERAVLMGAQVHLVAAKVLVRFHVGEHECRLVLRSSKWEIELVPDRAVRSIAANDESGFHGEPLSEALQRNLDGVMPLDRRHEARLILNRSAVALQGCDEQRFGDVLRYHGDERVWTLRRRESYLREVATMCHNGSRGHAVRYLEERRHEPGHVEDLESPRHDGKRL
jgi:hypothetical protein